MKISKRSRLSLSQFLPLLGRERIGIVFEKYDVSADEVSGNWRNPSFEEAVANAVLGATDAQVAEIVQELARTGGAIRSQVSPKVRYDEPWKDLELCLLLDNIVRAKDEYGQDLGYFIPTEPAIDGVQPVDDDLTSELKRSGLEGVDTVLGMIEESANAFRVGKERLSERRAGCVGNARKDHCSQEACHVPARLRRRQVGPSRRLSPHVWVHRPERGSGINRRL